MWGKQQEYRYVSFNIEVIYYSSCWLIISHKHLFLGYICKNIGYLPCIFHSKLLFLPFIFLSSIPFLHNGEAMFNLFIFKGIDRSLLLMAYHNLIWCIPCFLMFLFAILVFLKDPLSIISAKTGITRE